MQTRWKRIDQSHEQWTNRSRLSNKLLISLLEGFMLQLPDHEWPFLMYLLCSCSVKWVENVVLWLRVLLWYICRVYETGCFYEFMDTMAMGISDTGKDARWMLVIVSLFIKWSRNTILTQFLTFLTSTFFSNTWFHDSPKILLKPDNWLHQLPIHNLVLF